MPLSLLYRRVSTGHQDNSMDLQEHINEEYCKRLGLPVLEQTYEDDDTSGSIWFNDRAGGGALLARLQFGDITDLITAKQDRLGRDTLDTIATIRKVWELGITPHFPAEGGAFPRTPQNELLFEIKASVAQYERNLIRDRTRSIMRRKFELNQLTGNVPFGYDCIYTFANGESLRSARALPASQLPGKPISKQLVDNYPEQATIRRMKAWRDAGWKLERIANALNDEVTYTKLDCRWQMGNVASVLGSRHTARILQTPASTDEAEAA